MNIVVSGEGFGERAGAGVAVGLVRGAAAQGEAGQGGHRILPTLLEPSGEICHEEPSVTSKQVFFPLSITLLFLQATQALQFADIRVPCGHLLVGGEGELLQGLHGERAAAHRAARLQHRAADGRHGARVLRQLRLPGHQLLRGELALRRPRGAAGAGGHRARAGPHRAAGRGAQPRQVSSKRSATRRSAGRGPQLLCCPP